MVRSLTFTAVGFAVPKLELDDDPHRQVQQCLFLGLAINRLCNEAGTSHGRARRPWEDKEAHVFGGPMRERTALIAGALLDGIGHELAAYRARPPSLGHVFRDGLLKPSSRSAERTSASHGRGGPA